MGNGTRGEKYYVGWDVGGWNCDNNQRSRDALVVLNEGRAKVGLPWRGNLRQTINDSANSREFIAGLFALCGAEGPTKDSPVTLAIDTPLGFSDQFIALVTAGRDASPIANSSSNPYLFRQTERISLEGPGAGTPEGEGWIWLPQDGLKREQG